MRDSGCISVVGRESLSGIAIAFAVHSLDYSLFVRLRDFYRTGISIAFTIRSVDLFVRLIPSYKFSMKNGYRWHDEML